MLSAVMIVALAAFIGATVHASGPSKADYAALNQIKHNQDILKKDRAAYLEFLDAKQSNADAVASMKDGWQIDWSKMTLIPATVSFTAPLR